jgi:hypothetical protein
MFSCPLWHGPLLSSIAYVACYFMGIWFTFLTGMDMGKEYLLINIQFSVLKWEDQQSVLEHELAVIFNRLLMKIFHTDRRRSELKENSVLKTKLIGLFEICCFWLNIFIDRPTLTYMKISKTNSDLIFWCPVPNLQGLYHITVLNISNSFTILRLVSAKGIKINKVPWC